MSAVRFRIGTVVALSIVSAMQVSAPAQTAAKTETVRGYLMPFKCQYDDKQTHTRQCALRPECMATGYGLALADGSFLQFDLDGSKTAARVLKASKKESDLIAVAEGTRVGPLLHLRSLRIE